MKYKIIFSLREIENVVHCHMIDNCKYVTLDNFTTSLYLSAKEDGLDFLHAISSGKINSIEVELIVISLFKERHIPAVEEFIKSLPNKSWRSKTKALRTWVIYSWYMNNSKIKT